MVLQKTVAFCNYSRKSPWRGLEPSRAVCPKSSFCTQPGAGQAGREPLSSPEHWNREQDCGDDAEPDRSVPDESVSRQRADGAERDRDLEERDGRCVDLVLRQQRLGLARLLVPLVLELLRRSTDRILLGDITRGFV